MELKDQLTLAVALLAVVFGPWLAYQFALRQEHRKWARERKAEAYVEVLRYTTWEQVEVVMGEKRVAWMNEMRSNVEVKLLAFGSAEAMTRFYFVLKYAMAEDFDYAKLANAKERLTNQIRRELQGGRRYRVAALEFLRIMQS
jgi:hypothetical protein